METDFALLKSWLVGKFFASDDEHSLFDDDLMYHWRVAQVHDVALVKGDVYILISWDEAAARIVRRWSVLDGAMLHDDVFGARTEAAECNRRDNRPKE